ncbi:GHKL domain-containing protein [candidate division WOR-3 bacterium]|nr:GHKL domain-containing protein [candidate division WOR-3 bacterium]
MKTNIRRYSVLAIILLLLLGTFLAVGLVSGRRIMLDLIKEQARSFLSVVASTQENLIFAEARLEDEYIDRLIGACNTLDGDLTRRSIDNVRNSFGFHSVVVFDRRTRTRTIASGAPVRVSSDVLDQQMPISFEYFDLGNRMMMRFVYVLTERVYQVELSADEIQEFRTEFGINKIMNQIAVNPMVKYLVLQDKQGIISATPNVETISRIEDDSVLARAMEQRSVVSRIEKFNDRSVLELVRPFIVEDELLGIFRIGFSLDSYYGHVRKTEVQLIVLFLILFGTSFILFLLFMNYQSYASIKELFRRTLSAIEDGVLLLDRRHSISAVNDAFCNLCATEYELLAGNEYGKVFPGDPFDVSKVSATRKKIADEKRLFGRALQYATYPVFDEKQKMSGVITVLHDVTRIRDFEKEREEAERLVFLGNLVANFAHEMKNPLNGLSIGTQRLLKEFPSADEEYMRIVESIKKEIDVLNKSVNDFLTLARPRMRSPAPFSIAQILNDVEPLIEHEIREYDVQLRWNIESDARIVGNADDFRRAVLNILLNAIDAVRAVTGRAREVSVDLARTPDGVRISVADNGTGMDEQEKNRVFSPYFSTKKSGTGLGLYIAQKIIKDHGGEIDIVSRRNEGTTFEIALRT